MPEGTFLVGYANDIAAVITARNTEDVQRKLRRVKMRKKTCLDSRSSYPLACGNEYWKRGN